MNHHTPLPALKRTASGESRGSQTSRSSSGSSSKLLFGEIPSDSSVDGRSSRSNSSICNLVLSTSPVFLRFWFNETCRNAFLSHVPQQDLSSMRLVCHDFSTRAAPFLFEDISVTFRASTFTKPARMAALDRIGSHVKTVTFKLSHNNETFLPPLIDPMTGEEQPFLYEPQVHLPRSVLSTAKEPKYGTWEMTDLLIKQYPPLFHAATNVPAFIRAFSALPSLSHLKISCPGQDPCQRYRRDIVDYALISLRIAIERSNPKELDTLSLLNIHPAGLLYLQPLHGLGATPASVRTWSQIRKLAIHMDSFPFESKYHTEHLRLLHSYLRFFSPRLNRLFFRWRGEKGPSPLSLDTEPCLQPSSSETTSLHSCALRPVKFPHMRYMELENAITDARQISAFISRHRRVLIEFNFEDVKLRTGSWDDALSPLTKLSGNEEWKRRQEEVMDVPLILSPVNLEPRILGPLLEEQREERGQMTLSRWLSRGRSSKAAAKAKEQFWESSEHMKKFLRGSMFSWR